MGEAFLDNVESDNVLKISIPISELFNKPNDVIDKICLQAKETSKKVCIIPTFSVSEKEDEFYERIRFEEAFCDIYEKIEHPEKVFLEVRKGGSVSKKGAFNWAYEAVPLMVVKEAHDKIKLFTDDIKNSSLSPFEKTIALYMIATHFIKSYKGTSADINNNDSSVMHILSDDANGYKIQCAGYTDLFCRMAYECGIHTKEMAIGFIYDYDERQLGGHSVAVVDLDDVKYGIHGSFICDVRAESDDIYTRRKNESSLPDDTLNWFCLPFSDFNAYVAGLYGSKYPVYGINNKGITFEENKHISNERIDIMTISDAFKRVDEFRYGCESGKITDERNLSLALLLTVRGDLDKLKELYGQCQVFEMYNHLKSSIDTADELSQMMVSEEVNKTMVSVDSSHK